MVFTSYFYMPMRKHVSADLTKSHKLLLRTGMVNQLGSGLFTWLPLGLRVLRKITDLVRKHHDAMEFSECLAPVLHPADLWHESGRYNAYGDEMMRLTDRHNRELILGPTAEEVFVDVVRRNVTSTKDLPVNLYNIQDKFRDEIRPRFGLMRAREFLMSDAYSFHVDEAGATEFYNSVHDGYLTMFRDLGFTPVPIQQTDTGEIGGSMSHEFFAVSETGEAEIAFDAGLIATDRAGEMITSRGIELGHIFLLGTKYTESMSFKIEHNGKDVYPQMGCYGVGVSRLVSSYLEIFGTDTRIQWPKSVAPFAAHIIAGNTEAAQTMAIRCHNLAPDVILYENRHDLSFGERHAIADLVGAPHRIVLGNREVEEGCGLVNGEKMSIEQVLAMCRGLG